MKPTSGLASLFEVQTVRLIGLHTFLTTFHLSLALLSSKLKLDLKVKCSAQIQTTNATAVLDCVLQKFHTCSHFIRQRGEPTA